MARTEPARRPHFASQLALGGLDIYSAKDLSRALDDEQVRPLVQRLCRPGLEFSKLCDVTTLLREENKKNRL